MEQKKDNFRNSQDRPARPSGKRPRTGQRPAYGTRNDSAAAPRRNFSESSDTPVDGGERRRPNTYGSRPTRNSRDGYKSRDNRYSNSDEPRSRKAHPQRNDGDAPRAEKKKRVKRQPPAPRPRIQPPLPKTYDGTIRLNKYIANAGICSRREADKLIAAGSVMVNGKVITEMGFQVHEGDVVNYGGETLRSERKRYFLLNKPKGFITTVDDPQNRETVMMLIDDACSERIYPVGRLDQNTTGLLLFTNDGDLARRLTHPSTGVYKIYQVELDRPVTRDDMRQMREGIELEDGPIHVDDIQYVEMANDKRIVGVELHSGKNRIVRRIFEHFGYNVHKLDRTVFAGLTKKDLPRGRYRELTSKEVGYLKMI